jgi:hypothetical protein
MNKIKAAAAAGSMVKLALAGGTLWFGASKTLYNVEGGHRAIVFNRFEGIKDKVTSPHTYPYLPDLLVAPLSPIRWISRWSHLRSLAGLPRENLAARPGGDLGVTGGSSDGAPATPSSLAHYRILSPVSCSSSHLPYSPL